MSLHTEEHSCKNNVWTSTCCCGWEGQPHDDATLVAAAKVRDDYREHVEAVLGADAYYDCEVACRNCGSHHRQGVLIGTHVTSGGCARCGTRMLQPDNDVWDESRSRAR